LACSVDDAVNVLLCPAWRGRRSQEQLRRFIGTHRSRKAHYARLLVEALDLTSVPRPLDRVLART
jgi:hypothetical protein